MTAMANGYQELLDATIRHLEELQGRGVRNVAVSAETLNALGRAPVRAQAAPGGSQPSPHPQSAFSSPRPSPGPAIAGPPSPAPAGEGQNPLPSNGRGSSSEAVSPTLERPRVNTPAVNAIVRTEPARKAAAPVAGTVTALPVELLAGGEAPTGPALDPQAKAAAFADLARRVAACVKCAHLASSRKHTVFGVGSTEAQIMFVGEAPGADEDAQGEPFVGKAGQLLTKILETMGLKRGDVYIANILKCRPNTPGQSAGNRKPTPEEMQTCISYLHEQIDLIRPRVIVALGATAVEGLLGKTGITKLRGTWHTYRGTPLMPTYHPAYLLRNQSLAEKRRVWEDMLAVMEKLGMAVNEKQRRFFLPKQAPE